MFIRQRLLETGSTVCMACLFLAGCQSYTPEPPDLAAHHEAWLARTPSAAMPSSFTPDLQLPGASSSAMAEHAHDALSLEDAELIAMVFNAELRQARSRLEIAAATAEHAGRWDDPVLGAGIERVLASVAHPWEISTTVSFTLPISGRLGLLTELAESQHHTELHHTVAQEWQIRMTLRRTWFQWSATHEQLRIAELYRDKLACMVDLVRSMEEAGEMSAVRARPFSIEYAQHLLVLRNLETELQRHALQMHRLMGLPPTAVDTFRPRMAIPFPSHTEFDVPTILRRCNPTLRALHAEHDVAERTLALEIRKQYPDIVIGPGYGREDGSHRFLLGLSLPLPLFNRNQQAIAEAAASRMAARTTLETEYESLLYDYAQANQQYTALDQQVVHLDESIIPMIDAQYNAAQQIAILGEVDTLLLLDTMCRQYESQRDLLALQRARSQAALDIITLLCPAQCYLPDAMGCRTSDIWMEVSP